MASTPLKKKTTKNRHVFTIILIKLEVKASLWNNWSSKLLGVLLIEGTEDNSPNNIQEQYSEQQWKKGRIWPLTATYEYCVILQ